MNNQSMTTFSNLGILDSPQGLQRNVRREDMLLGMQKNHQSITVLNKAAKVPPFKTIKTIAQEQKPLSEVLDEITMFRYGYVPFIIAELAWDYADTVIDMAIMCNNTGTKKLSRAIRGLRKEYERYCSLIVSSDDHENGENNMYEFETGISKIFSLYVTNVKCDLLAEYSNVEENTIHLLVAVYECLIIVKSLLRYSAIWTEKAHAMAGYPVNDVMPGSVHELASRIVEFAGDMPVSDKFKEIQETYVKTIVTQIGLIELNIIN